MVVSGTNGSNNDGHDPPTQRLGKDALGRHAFEEQMPMRLARLIANEDSSNTVTGVIDHLAHVLSSDSDVETAYLSHSHTVQIHKLVSEGHHFCGYHNIQMLCLAIGSTDHDLPEGTVTAATAKLLGEKLTIPRIQDLIESAWDAGINAHGRDQTGGIKGTRKDIGTSEAEALFLHLGVPCTGHAFSGPNASRDLFDAVEAYFSASSNPTAQADPTVKEQPPQTKIHRTSLQPIFLQRPGHSVTIVGFERTRTGKRRFLTFDPAYAVPAVMRKSTAGAKDGFGGWGDRMAMWRYRKSEREMRRWKMFEMLTIDRGKKTAGT